MSEAEKQEGQKTVVAFITGLLIGGLLVWVFSSSPDAAPVEGTNDAETEQNDTAVTTQNDTSTVTTTKDTTPVVSKPNEVIGTGKLVAADQNAGVTVSLGDVQFPTTNGWVVVRDYMNGVPGNILGAARYSTEEGLLPKEVGLLRRTVKDSTYQVVFFTESGDKKFSVKDDTAIEGMATTFKAK